MTPAPDPVQISAQVPGPGPTQDQIAGPTQASAPDQIPAPAQASAPAPLPAPAQPQAPATAPPRAQPPAPFPPRFGPLALLHTSPVHVPVFDALRDADHPGLELRHLVDEELLARARREGPEAVAGDVRALLADAVVDGARVVLCTCSTIGAVAERTDAGVPVFRVDRPMAAAAVATGSRVVVLATVASTLEPTVALVEEEARRAAVPSRPVRPSSTTRGRCSRRVTRTAAPARWRSPPTRSPMPM